MTRRDNYNQLNTDWQEDGSGRVIGYSTLFRPVPRFAGGVGFRFAFICKSTYLKRFYSARNDYMIRF